VKVIWERSPREPRATANPGAAGAEPPGGCGGRSPLHDRRE
jgi:hypothetical protein